jgi:hypothetical protein
LGRPGPSSIPLDAGADGLEAVDLMGHGPERLLEEVHVLHEEVDGAYRREARGIEPVAATEGHERPEGQREAHGILDHPAPELALPVVEEDFPLEPEELPNGIAGGAARADVLGAGQLLLYEAV